MHIKHVYTQSWQPSPWQPHIPTKVYLLYAYSLCGLWRISEHQRFLSPLMDVPPGSDGLLRLLWSSGWTPGAPPSPSNNRGCWNSHGEKHNSMLPTGTAGRAPADVSCPHLTRGGCARRRGGGPFGSCDRDLGGRGMPGIFRCWQPRMEFLP